MIERIRGNVIEKNPSFCVLDCHGLGIGLHISITTYQVLERLEKGAATELYSHLHVREDVLQLYGFSSRDERAMFRLLITISGVGPKLALAILSGGGSEELRYAIASGDVALLTRIPGVGKKTAQRLVLELKEKIGDAGLPAGVAGKAVARSAELSKVQAAIMALSELGIKDADARRRVETVLQRSPDDIALEELVKQALKEK